MTSAPSVMPPFPSRRRQRSNHQPPRLAFAAKPARRTTTAARAWSASPSTNQSIGVCDLAKYGIVQSGKICSAECKVDIDFVNFPSVGGNHGRRWRRELQFVRGSAEDSESSGSVGLRSGRRHSRRPFQRMLPLQDLLRLRHQHPLKCDVATGSCAYVKKLHGQRREDQGCPVQTRTGAPTISTCKRRHEHLLHEREAGLQDQR